MMAGNKCRNCPLLEVLKTGNGPEWKVDSVSLENYLQQDDSDANLTLIFAQADKIRDCLRCRQGFTERFRMPGLWWAPWCRRSNGYFSCEDTTDTNGVFNGHNTWFRFLIKQIRNNSPENEKDYFWYKFNVFTRWLPDTNQSIILVFDPRPEIKKGLPYALLESKDFSESKDPYWIHAVFAEELVKLQDEAVWGIRDLVRETEIQRSTIKVPNPDYVLLHDCARHAIHVSETLDVAVKTISCLISQHDKLVADEKSHTDNAGHMSGTISKRLKFSDHMIESLRCRAASNKERLLNEIQLAFNLVAQYDSRVGVEVGQAAQIDSAAVKTIAFLTLIFLPATFVSAIFSMSFFDYDAGNEKWTTSKKFWLYLAVAVPITLITSFLWMFWTKFFPPKLVGEEELLSPRKGTLERKQSEETVKKMKDSARHGNLLLCV